MDVSKIARVLIGIAAIVVGIYALVNVLISGRIDSSALVLCMLLCCLCALTLLSRKGKVRSDDRSPRIP